MLNIEKVSKVLYCNNCDSDFNLIVGEKNQNLIIDGYLLCEKCDIRHYIKDDIIFIDKNLSSKGSEYQSKIYSYWWRQSHKDLKYDKSGSEKIFNSTLNLNNNEFKDKIVLDAGCGNGRFSDIIAESGAKIFVIADVSDGIFLAKKKIQDKNINLIAIKGDLNSIPFKKNVFDIIYSWGVIHHTSSPRLTFDNIAKLCKINGKLGVYVYKQNPEYKYNNMHLRFLAILRQYLVIQPLRFISQFLSEKNVIRLFKPIHFIEKIFNLGVVGCHSNSLSNKFEKKHYFRVVIDRFKTKYASEHQENEIINWYKENNFDDLIIGSNPKLGVTGTKKNNEKNDITVTFKY